MILEDFYPINDKEGLIVTGPSYNNLNQIKKVRYVGDNIKPKETIKTGTYLRLGNIYNDKLIYSDNYTVYEDDKFLAEGIQPYMTYHGLLYQHHGVIFLKDEILIKPQKDYFTVGRPSFYDGLVYYETRKSEAPKGWEVWKYDIKNNTNSFVINGCNPFRWKDILYYQLWNGMEFEICHKKE